MRFLKYNHLILVCALLKYSSILSQRILQKHAAGTTNQKHNEDTTSHPLSKIKKEDNDVLRWGCRKTGTLLLVRM